MNRRGFFSGLAKVATALVVAPQILVPLASDRMRWKRTETLWMPNRIYFIDHPPIYDPAILHGELAMEPRRFYGKWNFVMDSFERTNLTLWDKLLNVEA